LLWFWSSFLIAHDTMKMHLEFLISSLSDRRYTYAVRMGIYEPALAFYQVLADQGLSKSE
jgi:hypothetical protein